jgi:NAD(P)-dependent dehydrogenase (short-subunit alcohol dehydrogenase family)
MCITGQWAAMTDQPRRAIVTASDSGIGRATAVALAASGLDIGITWHSDEDGAQATAAEVRRSGVKAEVAQLDTSDLATCGDVVDELAGRLGGLDVFVNNAGTGSATMAVDMTIEEWRRVVAADLDGAFACLQRAARRMITAGRGGRLIAVTSVHEHQPRVGSAAYDAARCAARPPRGRAGDRRGHRVSRLPPGVLRHGSELAGGRRHAPDGAAGRIAHPQ